MARTDHRFRKNRSDLFFAGGLDSRISVELLGKIPFCARAIFVGLEPRERRNMTNNRIDLPVGTDVRNLKTERWREIVPEPSMFGMIRAVVIAALLACPPAIVRGEDRPKMPSDDRGQGIFCTSPKDRSDCIEACARLKDMERYRACTAACTNLYCPRK